MICFRNLVLLPVGTVTNGLHSLGSVSEQAPRRDSSEPTFPFYRSIQCS